jgi:hypothetical protein
MHGRWSRGTVLALLAGVASPPVSASPRFFGAVCDYEDTGDVFGYAVSLNNAGGRLRVTLSWSEGVMMAPVRATAVTSDPRSSHLAFTVPAQGSTYRFAGRVRGTTLSGELTGPDGPQRLMLKQKSSRQVYKSGGPCPTPQVTPARR